ncbi:MAG: phospholipase [Saprospirales bacterium]|jgi:predicted esterase|nr:phospholipase [Saprospirales bacterium]
MQHHKQNVSKTAQYYSIGDPGPQTRQMWIVCHGYAQLASEFLNDFQLLDNGHTLVIAPEGLNHFYKKGFSGDVGASWMTRHCREDEIADNGAYLQALYSRYTGMLRPDVRVVLLGFSQGTATVCRWILRYHPHFHDLVLWAGMPPEDLDYQAHRAYLADKNLYLLYGSHDPFLTPDRFAQLQEIEAASGVDFDEKPFEGGHEIPGKVLRDLLEKLR